MDIRPPYSEIDHSGREHMTGWIEFIMAMAAFMLSHLLPRVGGLRENLIKRLGRCAYFSLYGLVSLVLLGWVISASATGAPSALSVMAPSGSSTGSEKVKTGSTPTDTESSPAPGDTATT